MWKADLQENNFNSEIRFNKQTVFSNSHMANVIFAKQLSSKCIAAKVPVSINCTDIGIKRNSSNWFSSIRFHNSVQTAVHLAVSPDGKKVSGAYFSNCRVAPVPTKAMDSNLAEHLWYFSKLCVNLQTQECIV